MTKRKASKCVVHAGIIIIMKNNHTSNAISARKASEQKLVLALSRCALVQDTLPLRQILERVSLIPNYWPGWHIPCGTAEYTSISCSILFASNDFRPASSISSGNRGSFSTQTIDIGTLTPSRSLLVASVTGCSTVS